MENVSAVEPVPKQQTRDLELKEMFGRYAHAGVVRWDVGDGHDGNCGAR